MGIPNGHIITPESEILTYEGMRLVKKGAVLYERFLQDIAKRRNIP
jgi:hypothetical protein